MSLRGTGQGGTLARLYEAVEVLGSAGFLNPLALRAVAGATKKWGSTFAAGFGASASRMPGQIGLVDDIGSLTFGDIESRTNAIAAGLAEAGVKVGDGVGLFARNHRGFVESAIAIHKLGANALLLNTGFSAPQLAEVLDREGIDLVIHDEEFSKVVDVGGGRRKRFVCWGEGRGSTTLEDVIRGNPGCGEPDPPAKHGRMTILTSGTTGTPKGAQRESRPTGINFLIGMLGRLGYRSGVTTYIPAPVFHSWGGANLLFGALLANKIILRTKFDPEDALRTIEKERPEVMAVVPVMMQRILALGDDVCRRYDCSSLKIVGASGSALPGDVVTRWMDTFGDNIRNLYGSTEVGVASVAMPDELRADPGTAGRPPRGVVIKLFDEAANEITKPGEIGRIFVGSDAQFEGYTGGGDKEKIQGLMSSGDVGHFDEDGKLYIDGRDDDMIVSGGENVFPREVEDLLSNHDAIAEVAVIGVPDDEFGQRLKGFVVVKNGSSVNEADLKQYVRTNLARYKIPREIVFMDELPRNPTGKVLKRVLAEA